MSGWHWFSESGWASASAYLTRRDGLCADLAVGDVGVSMQVAPPRNLSVGIKFDINDDEPVTGHVGVWPLPVVYLSADAPLLRRLARALAGDTGREIRAWFGPDESVDHLSAHWSLWMDPCEYVCDTPRWRYGGVSPLAVLLGEALYDEEPVGAPETIEVAMPEGVYRVKVSQRDRVWTRPRWPGEWLRVRDVEVDVVDEGGIPVVDEGGIPVPGKGENSWDIDDDAVLSCSFPGVDVNTAVQRFVCGIHERRLRYGGPSWVPGGREREKETDGE